MDPGFTKGGGGIKYWICCLYYHTFIKLTKPQGGRWSKIVLLQKDLFFFFLFRLRVIFPIFIAFPVQIVNKYIPFHPFFGHNFLCFIFYLRPHPPLIQKRGHALHAYSYSYWDTPTSHQKGGGMCLKCPPPPTSTYA